MNQPPHTTPHTTPIVIDFANVSKRFAMHYERHISLPQRLAALLRPRRTRENETFWALRNVNFTIHRGESVGLIGHNGSGKSTTLKLITRILEPTSGSVQVNGRISALLELGSGFHPDLTGRENIYLNGALLGQSHAQMRARANSIIEFSEIGDFIDTPVKHYSSGMYMRLAFAIAISVDPDILLTDEVLAVGDDAFQRKCLDRIFHLRQQGRTIIFVSHALGVVQNLCDRVLWFDQGTLLEDGEPVRVIDAYLKVANERHRQRLAQERRREQTASNEPGNHSTAPTAADETEDDDPQRWGTREVEIVRVELLNRAGQPDTLFATSNHLTLRMHYIAHQRIEKPVFGVGIHHQNGLHINGPNTRFADYQIDAVEGPGIVDYTIESLPLLEGDYLFSAVIYDHSMSHPYDHHDRKYPFTVQAATVSERYGIIYIPSRWDWRPATRAP